MLRQGSVRRRDREKSRSHLCQELAVYNEVWEVSHSLGFALHPRRWRSLLLPKARAGRQETRGEARDHIYPGAPDGRVACGAPEIFEPLRVEVRWLAFLLTLEIMTRLEHIS